MDISETLLTIHCLIRAIAAIFLSKELLTCYIQHSIFAPAIARGDLGIQLSRTVPE